MDNNPASFSIILTGSGLLVAMAGFKIQSRFLSAVGVPLDGLWSHAVKFVPMIGILTIASAQGLTPADMGWQITSSLGFLGRVILGTGLMLVANVVVQPILEHLTNDNGAEETTKAAADLADTLHGKGVIAATAGITEEVTYNGYALERLAALTGNPLLAGTLTATAFTAIHFGETWNKIAVFRIAQPAIIVTALYLWWRSLPVLITVHALNDFIGLVVSERIVNDDAS